MNLVPLVCADVVLCSYEQLEKEANVEARSGMLQKLFWHRVVLDEVQMAEGRADAAMSEKDRALVEKRAKSAYALQAAHRWAVSATPMETPTEVHALLRFLRHQPFSDDRWWEAALKPALRVGGGAVEEGTPSYAVLKAPAGARRSKGTSCA